MGLALVVLACVSHSHAASFDCAKASTFIEKTICFNQTLSAMDETLARSYRKAASSAPNAAAVQADQRAWLTGVRDKCQDSSCLERAYRERIAFLDASGTAANATTGGANVSTPAVQAPTAPVRPAPAQAAPAPAPAASLQPAPAQTRVAARAQKVLSVEDVLLDFSELEGTSVVVKGVMITMGESTLLYPRVGSMSALWIETSKLTRDERKRALSCGLEGSCDNVVVHGTVGKVSLGKGIGATRLQ
jgi:uncharacterized protein